MHRDRALLPPALGAVAIGLVLSAGTLTAQALPGAAAFRAAPSPVGDELVRPGKWNPRTPPKGWVVIETEHYQVQSNCGKVKARALADHLEGMLELYEKFLPTRRKLDGFVLKLFRDRREFLDYSGYKDESGPIAYYNQSAGELVGYDTGIVLGVRDAPAQIGLAVGAEIPLTLTERQRLDQIFEDVSDAYLMDTARVLSHEGWHQYFHFYTVSIVTMPSWLDEGVGDYFFMATKDEQAGRTHGYRLGDINTIRMRTLRRALEDGSTVEFETLLGFAQEQYYTNPGVFYAQGWAMVNFLMHHDNPVYREFIPKLIKDFKDTKNFRKSTDKVFKSMDMRALDREWLGWVLSHTPPDPMRTLAREFGAKLKPDDLVADKRWLTAYKWWLEHPEFLAELEAAAGAGVPEAGGAAGTTGDKGKPGADAKPGGTTKPGSGKSSGGTRPSGDG